MQIVTVRLMLLVVQDLFEHRDVTGMRERLRMTRAQYAALTEQGLFSPDERCELIDGEVVARAPIGDRHAVVVNRLLRVLIEGIPDTEGMVGCQSPVALSAWSMPEPDCWVSDEHLYRVGHPRRTTLVVEVADSSLRYDLTRKAQIYADAGVPDYWVVDLQHDLVVMHRQPADHGYAVVTEHRAGSIVPLRHPRVTVDVGLLLR